MLGKEIGVHGRVLCEDLREHLRRDPVPELPDERREERVRVRLDVGVHPARKVPLVPLRVVDLRRVARRDVSGNQRVQFVAETVGDLLRDLEAHAGGGAGHEARHLLAVEVHRLLVDAGVEVELENVACLRVADAEPPERARRGREVREGLLEGGLGLRRAVLAPRRREAPQGPDEVALHAVEVVARALGRDRL